MVPQFGEKNKHSFILSRARETGSPAKTASQARRQTIRAYNIVHRWTSPQKRNPQCSFPAWHIATENLSKRN